MKQQDFLNKLESSLTSLDEKDKQDILDDFRQHFKEGLEQGKTEEEIATLLGNPDEIVKQFTSENSNEETVKQESKKEKQTIPTNRIFLFIALMFLNVCIVIPLMCAGAGVLFSLYGVVACLIIASVLIVLVSILSMFGIALLLGGMWLPVALAFLGVGLLSLGILSILGLIQLTKLSYKFVCKYTMYHINIVKGEC